MLRNKNTKNECRICKQKEKERVKEEEKAKRRKPNSNPRLKNLVGEQFGFLKVLKLDEGKSKPGQIYWQVKCRCGTVFSVAGKHLKRGATVSCGCIKQSYGEYIIESILQESKVVYKKEYVVPELGNKRFDFAIFQENTLIRLIEYDGEQHFKPSSLFGGKKEYEKRKKSDNEKNNWAIKNNIPLVRIPYTYKNDIDYHMLLRMMTF